MGGATSPELVAAVAEAGGFGFLPGIGATPERLRAAIAELRTRTAKPFGVNLVFKDDVAPLLDVALEARVAAVSFFWGDPAPYVDRVHAAGALVIRPSDRRLKLGAWSMSASM